MGVVIKMPFSCLSSILSISLEKNIAELKFMHIDIVIMKNACFSSRLVAGDDEGGGV